MAEGGDAAVDPVVDAVFARISSIVTDDLVTRTNAVYSFIVTDLGRSWYLDLRNKPGSCSAGDPGGGGVEVDTSLSLTSDTLQKLFSGQLSLVTGLMSGRLKISGSVVKAWGIRNRASNGGPHEGLQSWRRPQLWPSPG